MVAYAARLNSNLTRRSLSGKQFRITSGWLADDGAAWASLPLVGRVVSAANREGSSAHSNIDPKIRQRAKKLRTEMTKAEAAMWNMLRDLRPLGARFRRETPLPTGGGDHA
ncbi:hypothetical protein EFR01_07650 [Sinorhizobium fredii]|nr:hypothetical protein EFR01_07650 [Sinorhizobium fredii]GLS06529.1 hypothetical protein GCM10007864_01540 [Sinorhizobium fredii]